MGGLMSSFNECSGKDRNCIGVKPSKKNKQPRYDFYAETLKINPINSTPSDEYIPFSD